MRFPNLILSVLTTFVLTIPTHATAQNGLEQQLGPLAGIVELGDDGTWNMQSQGGWFTMTNTSAPGAVTYWYSRPSEAEGASYRVDLNVFVQPGSADTSYVGYLFNWRAGDSYMGVLLGSDGGSYFLVRNQDGFNLNPVNTDTALPKGDGTDQITAIVNGGTARFEVNGSMLVEFQNSQPFPPNMGIIGVGAGTMGYTNYRVTPGS